MNASDAKHLTLQNKQIIEYVENEISGDVRNFAVDGLFNCEVFVHTPDWYKNKHIFEDKAKSCLEELGYEVLYCKVYPKGYAFNISWENAI